MNESGTDSGFRNVGRFFLSLIPWALGIGAITWLSVWVGVHEYRREINQENRAATYVGASERPSSKLVIEVKSKDCSVITRADANGDELIIYALNGCHKSLDYLAWHWQGLSPDGTVIAQHYTNAATCSVPVYPGDKAECKLTISTDDRIKTLRIWTQITP
jgi:hypothetical protein